MASAPPVGSASREGLLANFSPLWAIHCKEYIVLHVWNQEYLTITFIDYWLPNTLVARYNVRQGKVIPLRRRVPRPAEIWYITRVAPQRGERQDTVRLSNNG